ncbi:transposase [Klebsiella pneumoniae]|nr:transposase [Klebsiella pneumoniae]
MGNWSRRRSASHEGGSAEPPARRLVSELEAENRRLRKELAETKLDVEILRKATAYFAKVSR